MSKYDENKNIVKRERAYRRQLTPAASLDSQTLAVNLSSFVHRLIICPTL